MPGGEVFYSPVEDSAEGTIEFSEFPGVYAGREVDGIKLTFSGGRVVDASARTNEDFLISTLDTDEGARRLGELGIGCNSGHHALHEERRLRREDRRNRAPRRRQQASPSSAASNDSVVHWDIVKDLRDGGRLEADGRVVQESGRWRHLKP